MMYLNFKNRVSTRIHESASQFIFSGFSIILPILLCLAVSQVTALDAFGQSCKLQQDCGYGNLCSSGTCQPIRSVLGTGSNDLFWVDAANGNDSNPGSESQPFRTIQRAVQSNAAGAGDAVIIREGTYYGSVVPANGGSPGNLLTITSFPGENVVVSGAENVPGTWTADGDAYRLNWPYDALWHRYEGPDDLFGEARRRDVLIADGQMLLAVYNRNDVREGTFYLEGSPYNPTTMYVMLPGRKDPNQALMQTSRTNHLFNPSTNESHCRFGDVKGYYHLIGITFRHTANDGLLGAVCPGNQGSILENLTSEWTNGAGFLISGSNHIVRGVRALNNGMSGIRGIYCDNCLIEHSTSKYNNWKGYNTMWESGGGKWLYTTNSTFRKIDFSDNEGPGLWLDMDNFDNVVEQSRFDNNMGANLFLEWTTDRTVVRNNIFTRGREVPNDIYHGLGVLIAAANDNMIVHNTFMNNQGGGLRIRADGRDVSTGNRYYNNLFITNHTFNPGQLSSEMAFENHTNDYNARTNKGEGNVFWYRGYESWDTHTFRYQLSGNDVRSSSLSSWQNIAQTDYSSWVMDLSQPHVVDTTDHRNGWRLPENSQFLGRAVNLPGDIPPVTLDYDGQPRPTSSQVVGADFPSDYVPIDDNNDDGNNDGGGDDGPNDGGGDDQDNPGDVTIQRVLFTSLIVLHEEGNIALFWEAVNERDLTTYEIERAIGDEDFSVVSTFSKGQTGAYAQSYTYRDSSIPDNATSVSYRVKKNYSDGSIEYSDSRSLSLDPEEIFEEPTTTSFKVAQNYPNPATSATVITYNVAESARVVLKLYDMLGREVRTMVDRGQPAGTYQILLDTSDLKSGMYFYRFQAGGVEQTRRMTVAR